MKSESEDEMELGRRYLYKRAKGIGWDRLCVDEEVKGVQQEVKNKKSVRAIVDVDVVDVVDMWGCGVGIRKKKVRLPFAYRLSKFRSYSSSIPY